MSRIFGIFGMHFDQLEGDTCHHWMGDTWHQGDVSSTRGAGVAGVTWQLMWHSYIGWQLDELYGDTWRIIGKLKGATWPNEGLPRGTPNFDYVGLGSKIMEPTGFEPVTSHTI